MAVTRAQKVRLGIFLFTGLAGLIGGLVVLAGMKLGEKRDSYTVRFKNQGVSLSGLDVGSPVKYSGIRIGRVENIRLDPEDVSVIEVTLSLQGDTPVAEDSVVTLGYLGITGLKYVELSRGSRSARIRSPGEEIPEGPSLLDDITVQATRLTQQAGTLMERLSELTGPDMRARLERVLDRTEKLLETTEQTVDENRDRIAKLTDSLAEASSESAELLRGVQKSLSRADRLIARADPAVMGVLSESRALVAELRQTRDTLDGLLGDGRDLMQNASVAVGDERLGKTLLSIDRLVSRGYLLLAQTRDDIEDAIRYLRETSENMTAFSQRVKDDPSLLLLGSDAEEEGD